MILPTFLPIKYVELDGFLTSAARMFNDELNNVLRNGLSDNGWTLPVVTKAELAKIRGFIGESMMPNGTIWVVQDTPPLPAPQYNAVVVLLDDGTGTGTSALYKFNLSAYP